MALEDRGRDLGLRELVRLTVRLVRRKLGRVFRRRLWRQIQILKLSRQKVVEWKPARLVHAHRDDVALVRVLRRRRRRHVVVETLLDDGLRLLRELPLLVDGVEPPLLLLDVVHAAVAGHLRHRRRVLPAVEALAVGRQIVVVGLQSERDG